MSAPDLGARVRAAWPVAPGWPVAVAFSGGRDSLCLLDLAATIAGLDAVLAVHVHHGLRARDADDDAFAAGTVARALGAALRVVVLRPPDELVVPDGPSAVPWARDARRAALRAAADAWGGPATPVLVAHTASDQAETVLLRAISSPGTRALAGIAPAGPARGVERPLLRAGASRADTGAWCAARGLPVRDDPTNPRTPRGRVRALLADLEGVDGRATAALVRTAALAREDDEALSAVAAGLVDDDGAALAAVAAAPVAVGRRALRLVAERALGRACPRVGARLEEVLALGAGGDGTGALDLGDGVRATVGGGRLRCGPSPRRA